MKEYNRQTRKWEVTTTEKVGDLKKRDLCRAKKPHDFVLVMPDYMGNYLMTDLPTDVVEKYYESEDRIWDFEKKEGDYKESLGIIRRDNRSFFRSYRCSRHYKCSVCGKKDYVTPKD